MSEHQNKRLVQVNVRCWAGTKCVRYLPEDIDQRIASRDLPRRYLSASVALCPCQPYSGDSVDYPEGTTCLIWAINLCHCRRGLIPDPSQYMNLKLQLLSKILIRHHLQITSEPFVYHRIALPVPAYLLSLWRITLIGTLDILRKALTEESVGLTSPCIRFEIFDNETESQTQENRKV